MQFYSNQETSTSKAIIDTRKVQAIIYQYQTEWQLWAKLSENFSDPHYHYAYISAITRRGELVQGIQRYQQHKEVFSTLQQERWQANIAEQMIEKIKTLNTVVINFNTFPNRQSIFTLTPYQRLWRIALFFIGLIGCLTLALPLLHQYFYKI